jgi:hypothetical protein
MVPREYFRGLCLEKYYEITLPVAFSDSPAIGWVPDLGLYLRKSE